MFRIQVKAKQGGQWPAVSGIHRRDDFLILVDFSGKAEGAPADFYILNLDDWEHIVAEELRKPEARVDEQKRVTYIGEKDGQSYVDWRGVNLIPTRVVGFKEQWQKILSRIDPKKTEALFSPQQCP
jgi:hypothetical protein